MTSAEMEVDNPSDEGAKNNEEEEIADDIGDDQETSQSQQWQNGRSLNPGVRGGNQRMRRLLRQRGSRTRGAGKTVKTTESPSSFFDDFENSLLEVDLTM